MYLSVDIVENTASQLFTSLRDRSTREAKAHLNQNIVLPMLHAAVIQNIRKGGRGIPFEPLSQAYLKYKKKANIKLDSHNMQPAFMGKQQAPKGKILILSSRLFNRLGTQHLASPERAYYGIAQIEDYMYDVIEGRESEVREVSVDSYIRRNKNGTTSFVRAHKKTMKTGEIPERSPFYIMPQDEQTISNALIDYMTAPLGVREIRIHPKIPFTAKKTVRIWRSK